MLRDLGLVRHGETFRRLRNQGMILGEDNEKMSKSRGNVIDPDALVARYGADTVRAYLMFLGPWDQGAAWNPRGIEGVTRFLNRVWNLFQGPGEGSQEDGEAARSELKRVTHRAIAEVTEDMEAFSFNTAIAELMTLQGALGRFRTADMAGTPEWREALETLLVLLAPIAPHIAEELWGRLGHEESVHLQPWPVHDEAALAEDSVTIAVQVGGRLRGQVQVAADAAREDVLGAARGEANVARYLEGQTVVREIFVPGRLVNFVVKPA